MAETDNGPHFLLETAPKLNRLSAILPSLGGISRLRLFGFALLITATIWIGIFFTYHVLVYGSVNAAWLANTRPMVKTEAIVTEACTSPAGGTDRIAWTLKTRTYDAVIGSRCPSRSRRDVQIWYSSKDPTVFIVGQSPDQVTDDAIFFSFCAVLVAAVFMGNAYRTMRLRNG